QFLNLPLDFALTNVPLRLTHETADQRIEREGGLMKFRSRRAREHEQIIDERPHLFCRFGNRPQMFSRIRIERLSRGGEEDFEKALDMAQRRAQIVRNRVAERLEFLIGILQLRRAFLHAMLEFNVESPDLLPRSFWPAASELVSNGRAGIRRSHFCR